MALLYIDGFDAGDMAQKGWSPTGQIVTGTSPATRFGTGRWGGVNNGFTKMAFPAAAQIFAGFSMANTYNDGSIRPFIYLTGDNGVVVHLSLGLTNSSLILYRGWIGATVIGQHNFSVAPNTFYNFEISATIHATTGTATVRMNGVNVITFTGNTKAGGTLDTIDGFGIGANGGMTCVVDDLYICDSTGPAPNNTFLGDVRVQTIVPNGAGSSTQFTPSSGANYTTVDELPYSASDHVQGDTSGLRDTYTLSDLPSVGAIYGVQNNVVAKKTDASSISLRPAIKSGASVYYGSPVSLGTADVTLKDLRAVDPNTSAPWTLPDVNSLEAGFEVV